MRCRKPSRCASGRPVSCITATAADITPATTIPIHRRADCRQSINRVVNCYANAFMGSCFGAIKTELDMTEYNPRQGARLEIASYLALLPRLPQPHRLRGPNTLTIPINLYTVQNLPIIGSDRSPFKIGDYLPRSQGLESGRQLATLCSHRTAFCGSRSCVSLPTYGDRKQSVSTRSEKSGLAV